MTITDRAITFTEEDMADMVSRYPWSSVYEMRLGDIYAYNLKRFSDDHVAGIITDVQARELLVAICRKNKLARDRLLGHWYESGRAEVN